MQTIGNFLKKLSLQHADQRKNKTRLAQAAQPKS